MRLSCFLAAVAGICCSLVWPRQGLAQTTMPGCVASGVTLAAARQSYDQQCSAARQDCDRIDDVWYCASVNIATGVVPVGLPAGSFVPQLEGGQPASPIGGNGVPVCRSVDADEDGDGWGWEDQRSCVVTAESGDMPDATGVAPPPVAAATAIAANGRPSCLTDASEVDNSGFGFENNRTCIVTGATATRDRPLLNQRICTPWMEIPYGNYRLQNNTWNSAAVFTDSWSQCISLGGSEGNYVARWDYNWLARNEGNEYAVKSYPQVYYGRKTGYNLSGSVEQTGLPVPINNMPRFRVDYDYSETGQVERNVALESFFHTSCDAEEHNKQFEMMVWVGVPAIRTPGVLSTSVALDGQDWDVFTNPQLGWGYVAFVARQPSQRGTLDWNAFVDWTRFEGPAFGVPSIAANACMGAIEIGTETFWGSGTFTLNRFNVLRNQ